MPSKQPSKKTKANTPASKRAEVIAQLRIVYDPELPVNIYDLKLIYGIVIKGADVHIIMTLTSPACPVAEQLPLDAESSVRKLPWVKKVEVSLTFEPPWSPQLLEDDVRLAIGYM